MKDQHLVILLAEDDDGHASLIQRNLERAGVANQIVRAKDGQEALDYVQNQGAFAGRPAGVPLLILLDIHMPRVDGTGVLKALKADAHLAPLPVIVLTTTDDPREVDRCYQLGCSAYLTKPVRHDEFAESLGRLGQFLKIIQVPSAAV